MDVKREQEFVIDMLEDQNDRIHCRDNNQIDNLAHKIEILRLNQQKTKDESKLFPSYLH